MRTLIIIILILFNSALFAQDDRSVFFRKETIFQPRISTNGYGIGYMSAKKRTIDKYVYWQINISEIKHRKEIKGVNPKYPSQGEFVFGKVNHMYPVSFIYGMHKKIVLKNNRKAIGLRYYFGAGPSVALLKPVFYQIELVYSQDSSRVFIDQFDPDYHNVNNIKERSSWFTGIDETGASPGLLIEAGAMVDFSRKPKRIQGVSLSAGLYYFILPAEVLAGDSQRRLYFGFNLGYVWGKIKNYKNQNKKEPGHNGWSMLKKY